MSPGPSVLLPRLASQVTLVVRADARDVIYLSTIYHLPIALKAGTWENVGGNLGACWRCQGRNIYFFDVYGYLHLLSICPL